MTSLGPLSTLESPEAATDRVGEALLCVLGEFDTETLVKVADHRAEVTEGKCWMVQMIRQYVEVWR